MHGAPQLPHRGLCPLPPSPPPMFMAFEHNTVDCNNDEQHMNAILGRGTQLTISGQSRAFQDRWSTYPRTIWNSLQGIPPNLINASTPLHGLSLYQQVRMVSGASYRLTTVLPASSPAAIYFIAIADSRQLGTRGLACVRRDGIV